jgi:hypothetical protein
MPLGLIIVSLHRIEQPGHFVRQLLKAASDAAVGYADTRAAGEQFEGLVTVGSSAGESESSGVVEVHRGVKSPRETLIMLGLYETAQVGAEVRSAPGEPAARVGQHSAVLRRHQSQHAGARRALPTADTESKRTGSSAGLLFAIQSQLAPPPCIRGILLATHLGLSDCVEYSGGMLTTNIGCSASILVFSLPYAPIRVAS